MKQENHSSFPTSLSNIFPEIKEEKAQKFTTIVLTLIAFTVFGLFAISPTLGTITELQKKIEDSNLVLGNLTTKITSLTNLHREFQDLQADLPYLLSAVPKNANVPELVGELQKVAADNSISLSTVQVSEVELTAGQGAGAPLHSFTFILDAQGPKSNILQFLTDITSFQRIVVIDTLSLRNDSSKANKMIASIKGTAYFRP